MVVRAAALLALLGALVGWYEAAPHIGGISLWHSILLIAFAMRAFSQKWNIEVEVTRDEANRRYGGSGTARPATAS